jgi:hypothetical protein
MHMKRLIIAALLLAALASVGAVQRYHGMVVARKNVESGDFTYYSTYFDGTNDYMRIDSSSLIADGKTGLVSFWIKMDDSSSDTTGYIPFLIGDNVRSNAFYVERSDASRIKIYGYNSSGTLIFYVYSGANTVTKGAWHHVLASWDLSTAGRRYIYIDGVASTTQATFTDDNIFYSVTNSTPRHIVGSLYNGSAKIYGYISEFYFTNEWLDISVESNRLKFRTSGGKPEDLGADGSTPTGTQPKIYLPNPYSTFNENAGSIGDFTVTGALGDGGAEIP